MIERIRQVRRAQRVRQVPHAPDGERGMVTGFVAIVATGLIFVAGLVYDGGQMINTYLEASDLAGNAARAAAQATSPAELYRSGTVRLDPDEAQERAAAFLAQAGYPGAGTTAVDGNEVTVTVTLEASALILPIGSKSLEATASATAVRGVEQPTGAP
jgi:Flp pilus assembly protein TadG